MTIRSAPRILMMLTESMAAPNAFILQALLRFGFGTGRRARQVLENEDDLSRVVNVGSPVILVPQGPIRVRRYSHGTIVDNPRRQS